jgi:hypothetical protein
MSYEDLTDARTKRVEQEEEASAYRQKLQEARAKRTEQEENGNVSKSRKQTSVWKRKVGSSRLRDPNTGSEASHANEETGPSLTQRRQRMQIGLEVRLHHVPEGFRLRRCGRKHKAGEKCEADQRTYDWPVLVLVYSRCIGQAVIFCTLGFHETSRYSASTLFKTKKSVYLGLQHVRESTCDFLDSPSAFVFLAAGRT